MPTTPAWIEGTLPRSVCAVSRLPETDSAMIRLIDARKNFGRQTLYDGVDASIVRGERIGLLGKNGSGKSTLFKVFMGQEHLDAGTLIRDRKCSIGYLLQE